jgi:PAS domain S-box-containing protein
VTTRPDPGSAGRGPGAPIDRLGAAALRSGSLPVRLHGVRDAAHLDGLIGILGGIRGVDDVRLCAYESIHSPVLVLHATRPIALAAELRTELGRQLSSCALVDGRLEVQLDGAAKSPPPTGVRRTKGTPGIWARPATAGTTPSRAGEPDDHAALAGAVGADGVRQAIDAIDGLSVLAFDRELRFVRASGAVRDRPDQGTDLLGRRPIDIVGASAWPALAPGYEGALAGRTTTLDARSPDGQRRYEATFRPLFDGPRIIGGTVTLLDVTVLRRDERMLAELREVFASSFDHSPLGQALLSPEGQWMRVNAALRRLVDRSDESLVGTYLHELTHHDDRAEEERLLQAVRTGERDGYDVRKRVVRGDGQIIDVHARLRAIRTDLARLRGFIVHVDALDRWPTVRR